MIEVALLLSREATEYHGYHKGLQIGAYHTSPSGENEFRVELVSLRVMSLDNDKFKTT